MPDGVKQEGTFKNGSQDGEFIVTFADGTQERQVFKEDKFISYEKIN